MEKSNHRRLETELRARLSRSLDGRAARRGEDFVVAKGNDGNYLQHSIEVSLAWQLVSRTAGNQLYVALTHGMAPYEPCGAIPNGQTKSLLDDALRSAQGHRRDVEAPVVSAYRATQATLDRYPNTGELLAA